MTIEKPILLVLQCGFLFVAGCGHEGKVTPAKLPPPAEVSKKVAETDLIRVKLTPEAEKRLGIEVIKVAREKVQRSKEYSGELLLPLGRQSSGDGASRSIFSLVPAMTATDLVRVAQMQVEAEGQVQAAEAQFEGARVALRRAEELIANKAGVGRSVDDAKLQVRLAEAALRTAQERRALLGAPVFEAHDVLWVRVSVYSGDVPGLNLADEACLRPLGVRTNTTGIRIKPVSVPISTGGPAAATDLYFELANDGTYRPGQKFLVAIPQNDQEESIVLPTTAILYDVHGDTWVYEQLEAHTFARRRVELSYTESGKAVVRRGISENAEVVTHGCVELFGTEFGPGK